MEGSTTQENSLLTGDGTTSQPSTNGVSNAFSIDNLRLSQAYRNMTEVSKIITTVPVRKPMKQEFIRVHPGKDWQIETAVIELKEDREHYLVFPGLWSELLGDLTPKLLLTAVSRQGVVFLWPIRLPGEDGRLDAWNQSALEASQLARDHWVRVSANMSLGGYEVFQASGALPKPEWPTLSFEELVNIAFKGKMIASIDHPVIAKLRGLR